jgi:hypothetical protein
VSLAASRKVQPSAWSSWEPFDLSGLEPNDPPWVSLDLSAFDHLFWGPASRLTVPKTIWPWMDLIRTVPLGLQGKLPLSVFRMVDINYSLCIFCIFSILIHFNFFSFFVQIFSSNVCFQLTFSSETLFNHCLIIIWLLFDCYTDSDRGNVFHVFRSCREVTIACYPESINIISSSRLAYFHLSIGCCEGLSPP